MARCGGSSASSTEYLGHRQDLCKTTVKEDKRFNTLWRHAPLKKNDQSSFDQVAGAEWQLLTSRLGQGATLEQAFTTALSSEDTHSAPDTQDPILKLVSSLRLLARYLLSRGSLPPITSKDHQFMRQLFATLRDASAIIASHKQFDRAQSDLLTVEAALASMEGQGIIGEIGLALAMDLDRARSSSAVDGSLAESGAQAALRAGRGTLAIHYATQRPYGEQPSDRTFFHTFFLLTALRMTGRFEEAGRTLESLMDKHPILNLPGQSTLPSTSPTIEEADGLLWESVLLHAATTRQLDAIKQAVVGKQQGFRSIRYILYAKLLGMLAARRDIVDHIPSSEQLRRISPDGVSRSSSIHRVYSWVKTIEKIYGSTSVNINDLHLLMEQVGQLSALPSIEEELLVTGAVATVLSQRGLNRAARVLADQYGTLSARLTAEGPRPSRDVYGFFSAAPGIALAASPAPTRDREIASVASSAFIRLAHIGLAVGGSLRIGLGSPSDNNPLLATRFFKRDAKTAKRIAALLGTLKGPLMKVGQIIGSFDDLRESVIVDELAKLQQHSPRLKAHAIRRIVTESLGQTMESLFTVWDDNPLASASIGQVHKAQLKTGEWVAVKVQYPHIRKAVHADIRLLKMFAPLIASRFHNADVKGMIDFMEQCILLECDYAQEAIWQDRYSEMFQSHPTCRIPRVFRALSRPNVLVSELVGGQDFHQFLLTSNQAERDHAGSAIFEFMTRSLYERGWFYADPHPGNYRFDGGKVWFLDFGSILDMGDEFTLPLRHYVSTLLHTSDDQWSVCAAAWRTMSRSGPLGTPDGFDDRFHHDLICQTVARPWRRDEVFTYSAEFVREESRLLLTGNRNLTTMHVPPVYIRLMRLVWGLHTVLGKLGSSANFHQILTNIIPNEVPTHVGKNAS